MHAKTTIIIKLCLGIALAAVFQYLFIVAVSIVPANDLALHWVERDGPVDIDTIGSDCYCVGSNGPMLGPFQSRVFVGNGSSFGCSTVVLAWMHECRANNETLLSEAPPALLAKNSHEVLIQRKLGWPLIVAEPSKAHYVDRKGAVHEKVANGANAEIFGAPNLVAGRRVKAFLPLQVLAIPFLINTMLYAIAMYIAISCTKSLISASLSGRRRRASLCTSCGYRLAGVSLLVCPECGSSIS